MLSKSHVHKYVNNKTKDERKEIQLHLKTFIKENLFLGGGHTYRLLSTLYFTLKNFLVKEVIQAVSAKDIKMQFKNLMRLQLSSIMTHFMY